MFILDILLLITGVIVFTLGYMICFRKRFGLVGGFEKNFKNGNCNEAYAIATGMILLMSGVVEVFCGLAALIVSNEAFSVLIFASCMIIAAMALAYNNLKSVRRNVIAKAIKSTNKIASCNG